MKKSKRANIFKLLDYIIIRSIFTAPFATHNLIVCYNSCLFRIKLLLANRYYAFENKPQCVNCYHSHAGLCSGCGNEILDFLSVDMSGNFWHKACWKCAICQKIFENNEYTIDTKNISLPVHIECFQQIYQLKCAVCGKYCTEEYYEVETDKVFYY